MIRSLTIGVPIFDRAKPELAQQLGDLRRHSQALSTEQGIELRTVRLTLPPSQVDADAEPGVLRSVVEMVRELADIVGARWYCMPLDLFATRGLQALLDEAQALVLRDNKLFLNLIVATPEAISMDGAEAASRFILGLSRRSNNGIDNFRVGVSAACPAATPFFPFSRHEGDELAFSLAMETTAIALELAAHARQQRLSLARFQDLLIEGLAAEMARVDTYGRALEERSGVAYRGLDGSFAPFPDGVTSVARLVELLGPTPVGSLGSIFITSVLTDALKQAAQRAGARTVGFNGVMYSVLEDNGLTEANNLRALSLEKLAALSTVCGCGIDMVPVPSTMFGEDLSALILDIAALAVRLRKPLGVRLLPIPNRAVNEYTQLNLDFLCDSRVMDPGISASKPLLCEPVWRYAADRSKEPQ